MSEPATSLPELNLSSGSRLPDLGHGTWLAAPGEVGQAVAAALKLGYRHIDCAASYGNAELAQIAALDRHHRFVDGSFWELPVGPYTKANLWDESAE